MAEVELSALSKQCLRGRIPDMATLVAVRRTLRRQTQGWTRQRNAKQKGVHWQFTTADARIRLNRFYPEIRC